MLKASCREARLPDMLSSGGRSAASAASGALHAKAGGGHRWPGAEATPLYLEAAQAEGLTPALKRGAIN